MATFQADWLSPSLWSTQALLQGSRVQTPVGAHVPMTACVPTVLPEGDPPSVRQLPRQADPQGLPGQVQPQEDEEVSGGSQGAGGTGAPGWDGGHSSSLLCRLEKEYAAMKSKEMEEQIEIKVSPRGGGSDGEWDRHRWP